MSTQFEPARSYEHVIQNLKDNPRTWVITGVAGYVGFNLARKLLSLGQRVVGLDDFSSSIHEFPNDFLHWLMAPQGTFELVVADVANPYSWTKVWRSMGDVDHVVHLAAKRSVPLSFQSPADYYYTNVYGTLVAYEEALALHAKSFVYASSSSVYGGSAKKDLLLYEGMTPNPTSPYADSKLAAERALSFKSNQEVFIAGLRFFNIYGPDQDGTKDTATVVPIWTHQLLNRIQPQAFGGTNITRDFVHIEDVIQGIILASVNGGNSNEYRNEVFNIGSGNSFSLRELFNKMRDKLFTLFPERVRKDVKLDITDQYRAGDVMHTKACIWRAQTCLGYTPKYDLDRGLDQVFEELAEVSEFLPILD